MYIQYIIDVYALCVFLYLSDASHIFITIMKRIVQNDIQNGFLVNK